jgi:hypothetical protein
MSGVLQYLNLDSFTVIGGLFFAAVFSLPIIPAQMVARRHDKAGDSYDHGMSKQPFSARSTWANTIAQLIASWAVFVLIGIASARLVSWLLPREFPPR